MTAERAGPHGRVAAIGPSTPAEAACRGSAAILAAAVPAHRAGLPWRLRWVDRGFELRANRRSLPDDDPGARELRLVSGAALLEIRLGVSVQGRRPVTTLVPDPSQPGLLAVLRIGERGRPTPEELALHEAAADGFAPRPAVPPVRAAALLRRAAETEGAWLRTVPTTRSRSTGETPPAGGPVPLTVVLGGYDDRPVAQLQAGQAMRRVELTASVLGLDTAVLPVAVDDPDVRRTLTGLVGPGLHPQVVLRVGARETTPA
ncbi:hypothetical protein [Pseudonocardia acidicola]|uniref:Nitroreductase n=1 Tax=Pseudonocardia acidicola TaxID=2724939 RepID=A0ABX1SCL7_9PSEU|nr:hypothetical protein [Pseudonocardia acidicola]NMH99305.1 hypothetical protein [Pseudonocardia acidicola]